LKTFLVENVLQPSRKTVKVLFYLNIKTHFCICYGNSWSFRSHVRFK